MAPQPHAIIDDKSYPVYLNGKHRDHAARRSARGSYRSRKGGLSKGHVKPRKSQTGGFGKSALVIAAVIGSKTRARHEMDSWGGEAAASAYKGPLKTALKRSYPGRRNHTVLEDNAPSGYKSGAGMKAKSEAGITTLDLPKRSPDLNVLDYSLWSQINTRMRAQEREWPAEFKESRRGYKARLRRTALGLPKSVVGKAVKAMKRRLEKLKVAKGMYFDESGKWVAPVFCCHV